MLAGAYIALYGAAMLLMVVGFIIPAVGVALVAHGLGRRMPMLYLPG